MKPLDPMDLAELLREMVWLGELYGEPYTEAQKDIACRYLLGERRLPIVAIVQAIHEATAHWPDWRPRIPQIAQVARDIAKRLPKPELPALPEPQFPTGEAQSKYWRDMVGVMNRTIESEGFTDRTPMSDPRAKEFGKGCLLLIMDGLKRTTKTLDREKNDA
jgi:hypothetical protein